MKKIPAFITLTIITLIAAALLAITDSITREPISLAAMAVSDAARLAVLPAATSFEQVESAEDVDALYVGSAGGQVIGHTAAITVQGYGGEVELTVGMDVQGVLTGLSVGGSNFAETAGLGSKAKEPEFTDQFIGKTVPVALGESIDAISGATITSRAVVEGVNRAAKAMGADVPAQTDMSDASAPEKSGAAQGDLEASTTAKDTNAADALPNFKGKIKEAGSANASVMGFAGPVQVRLSVDTSGVITALTIGGPTFAETKGHEIREDSFAAQFVGKQAPVALSDIDAVSGATISSQAAVDAVNAAYVFMCR